MFNGMIVVTKLVISADILVFSFISDVVKPIEFSAFKFTIASNQSSVDGSENLIVEDSDRRWATSFLSWVACVKELTESVARASV